MKSTTGATMTRTDIHRPSFLDPAEYEEVGYFDLHPEDGGGSIDEEYADKDSFLGNFASRGRCDHCGAGPLRYIVIFYHSPSDKIVTVGVRCAGILGLSSKSERERRQRIESERRERLVREWIAKDEINAEVVEFLNDVVSTPYHDEATGENPFRAKFPGLVGGGTIAFLSDLLHKLNRYSNLTENQVAAVQKIKARNDERLAAYAARTAELAEVAPLAEGRREITGTIVSTKWVEGFGGDDVMKMLVEEADGNRVYGTVPSYLKEIAEGPWSAEQGYYAPVELKGLTITFKAQVERSSKDEHFGFFKRPTGTKVIEEVAS
jgi:hypothetical protein